MTIESYLPPNCVTDGSVDYTAQLQKGINAAEIIDMPPFPVMVSDRGIILPSDREIFFHAPLIQKATSNGSYNAIRIQKVNNVILHNPVVSGERQKHIGTTGEWGHGISINGSSNVTINSPNVSYCWGDGIYIAGKNGTPSRNITINDATCTHNRRNGISIVSVIGLRLNSPNCSRTYGTLPMCGIDIEPANKTDEIQDVIISNPITDRSQEYGIAIALSELLGGTGKVIDIKIINWSDSYSKAALRASIEGIGVSGTINIINPSWKYYSSEPIQVDIRTDDIKLNIVNPSIRVTLKQAEIKSLLTKKTNMNANYKLSF